MKKLVLIALLFTAIQIQANSAVSVDRTTTKEYLINNGYSKQISDSVNVSKARALGEEYYTEDELKLLRDSKPKKFWRRLYNYFDPAAEDYSFYHHDTRFEPHYTDL